MNLATRDAEAPRRWRVLAIVATGELLAMAPWFSASAVAPLLVADWRLDRLGLPALTIAVQLGFAVGAIALALTAAADVFPARVLFAAGAFGAAAANLGFAFVAQDPASALPFRVVTGMALAGVYPIGLKLLAGWFRRERGLAIGVLVGALTIGSALPLLLRALGASEGIDWRMTVGSTSLAGILGGLVVLAGVSDGPWDVAAPRFSLDVAKAAFREMHRQVGDLTLDRRGVARRGLLVRHLVLPNTLAGTGEVVRFLAELSKDTYLNIMKQYRPCYRAHEYPPLARRPTRAAVEEAVRLARDVGLHRLDGDC